MVKEPYVADINQDLLLAVLALLTDTLPRDELRTALSGWSQAPGRSLADYFREHGTLDDRCVQALQYLVSAHLKHHNGNLQLSLDAWNAQALTYDMLTELEGSAVSETIGDTLLPSLAATLRMPQSGARAAGGRPDIQNVPPRQRFELIQEHAKGGIGQVWLARDRELQREVAVKEIQPKYAERDDQRARFLLEAEITGNLEHPGIVPVYSLGRNAEGRPYYAMRFIRGESLSVAIKQFHKARRGAQASQDARAAWGVEFQQLLRRFLDVCDAIEYAQRRGGIRRDLKPGNIMLCPDAETLVVDWGLAKVVGKSDIFPAPGEADEASEGDDSEPDLGATAPVPGGETQPGTSIGTPSYMSPEQARGDLERIGPASDVYSLGATLYELLTGTVPLAGQKPSEIIARVVEGKIPPPRLLLPSIPPALEAICLKAMAFEPEQRYQSARELALDLEHWIADEPVSAYPEQRLQKLARWMRRHRSWTYAAAAALI